MRSGDVALRLSIVFSVAGFIALAASLYEVDRREKSNSATAAVNLIEIEQQVQVLNNQIRILSNQLGANERQAQRGRYERGGAPAGEPAAPPSLQDQASVIGRIGQSSLQTVAPRGSPIKARLQAALVEGQQCRRFAERERAR